jgi:glyoxylase-like metal-dependent hydrolase (beta-lactamase superfamily II)
MPLEDDFCDIIKKARRGRGLSMGDLAQASGLSAGDVTILERGGRLPTKGEIEALAAALHLRTAPLMHIVLDRWMPAPPRAAGPVETVMGDINGYAVKGYVVYDSGEALFVDTAYNEEAMLEVLERKNLTLKAVCLTHGHSDHAGGLDVILQHHRVPVYLGMGDRPMLGWIPPGELMMSTTDGQTVAVGRLTMRFVVTPGHTPGGICYKVEGAGHDACFVGDTLFAGSIGGSNPASLYQTHLQSVRTRVLTLPLDTTLLPGHGPATTVREELTHNPFADHE